MAKRISFNDRLEHARKILADADMRAQTPGLRNELNGMRKMFRVFAGEHDETIKAEGKHRGAKMVSAPTGGGE